MVMLLGGTSLFAAAVFAEDPEDAQEATNAESPAQFHDIERTAGAVTFRRVQTKVNPLTTSSTAWTNLSAGTVPVLPGRTALITGRWTGETSCVGGGAVSNWCTMRIRINGQDAHPRAFTDFAIDSTNGGTAPANDWEGHVIERHWCVRNPSTTATLNVSVAVDWAVRDGVAGAPIPVFRTDDWSFVMERADNCSPVN
jgi:hypothetical protein